MKQQSTVKKKGSLSSSNTVLIFNHAGPVEVTMQHFKEIPWWKLSLRELSYSVSGDLSCIREYQIEISRACCAHRLYCYTRWLTQKDRIQTSLCLRGSRQETQPNQSLNDTMTHTDYCSREPKIIIGGNKSYSFVQLHVNWRWGVRSLILITVLHTTL